MGEIKAEMGRQDIGSVRALWKRIDESNGIRTNHVYWNDRLNKKPGLRVAISMDDLARICAALEVEPWELVRRAGVEGRRHNGRQEESG